MNEKDNLEILLLLSCLVGVITFLCFAMGLLNVATGTEQNKIPDSSLLQEQHNELLQDKRHKEEEIARLEEEINKLGNKITDEEKILADNRSSEINMEIGKEKKELKKLKEELENILKLIKQKEEKLENMRKTLNRFQGNENKENELTVELDSLKKQAEELEDKIEEKEAELAKIPLLASDFLDKDIESLRKAIEAAEKTNTELQKELAAESLVRNTFNPWRDFKGTVSFRNPLFVECKEKFIMLYPGEKVFAVSDLNKDNPFSEINNDHDGIVFLIRPNGFKSFTEGFYLAKKTDLPLAYEPVDSNLTLDFKKY